MGGAGRADHPRRPQSPLRWTKPALADELTSKIQPVGAATVATLLPQLKYRRHALRKTSEGASHPDRDPRFRYTTRGSGTTTRRLARPRRGASPAVSIDAKRRELVGDFKNGGREWQPYGQPERVRAHGLPDKAQGKVTPYVAVDLTANQGWVSVGTDHGTATFAVDTVRRWWEQMGVPLHPGATDLLVTADGGGSNTRPHSVGSPTPLGLPSPMPNSLPCPSNSMPSTATGMTLSPQKALSIADVIVGQCRQLHGTRRLCLVVMPTGRSSGSSSL